MRKLRKKNQQFYSLTVDIILQNCLVYLCNLNFFERFCSVKTICDFTGTKYQQFLFIKFWHYFAKLSSLSLQTSNFWSYARAKLEKLDFCVSLIVQALSTKRQIHERIHVNIYYFQRLNMFLSLEQISFSSKTEQICRKINKESENKSATILFIKIWYNFAKLSCLSLQINFWSKLGKLEFDILKKPSSICANYPLIVQVLLPKDKFTREFV